MRIPTHRNEYHDGYAWGHGSGLQKKNTNSTVTNRSILTANFVLKKLPGICQMINYTVYNKFPYKTKFLNHEQDLLTSQHFEVPGR